MKLFLAIGISTNPELDELRDRLLGINNSLRIVPPMNYHVTVRFYGEMSGQQLADLLAEIPACLTGSSEFNLKLKGLGAFPKLAAPRVIWAGVERTDDLIRLANEMEQLARRIGFEPEVRPYRPHLTLARQKRKATSKLKAFIENCPDSGFGDFSVNRITLYRSESTSTGPIYSAIEHFPIER